MGLIDPPAFLDTIDPAGPLDYRGISFGVAVEFQNEHKVLKNYTDARLRTIIKRALRNAKGHALLVCFQHFKIDNCSTWIRK